jgi:hypothetical protein
LELLGHGFNRGSKQQGRWFSPFKTQISIKLTIYVVPSLEEVVEEVSLRATKLSSAVVP